MSRFGFSVLTGGIMFAAIAFCISIAMIRPPGLFVIYGKTEYISFVSTNPFANTIVIPQNALPDTGLYADNIEIQPDINANIIYSTRYDSGYDVYVSSVKGTRNVAVEPDRPIILKLLTENADRDRVKKVRLPVNGRIKVGQGSTFGINHESLLLLDATITIYGQPLSSFLGIQMEDLPFTSKNIYFLRSHKLPSSVKIESAINDSGKEVEWRGRVDISPIKNGPEVIEFYVATLGESARLGVTLPFVEDASQDSGNTIFLGFDAIDMLMYDPNLRLIVVAFSLVGMVVGGMNYFRRSITHILS